MSSLYISPKAFYSIVFWAHPQYHMLSTVVPMAFITTMSFIFSGLYGAYYGVYGNVYGLSWSIHINKVSILVLLACLLLAMVYMAFSLVSGVFFPLWFLCYVLIQILPPMVSMLFVVGSVAFLLSVHFIL